MVLVISQEIDDDLSQFTQLASVFGIKIKAVAVSGMDLYDWKEVFPSQIYQATKLLTCY